MKNEIGGKAVKQHADEFGLSDGLSKIMDVFGRENVQNIEIISEGRRTGLRDISTDLDRVVPGNKAYDTALSISKKNQQVKPSWKK